MSAAKPGIFSLKRACASASSDSQADSMFSRRAIASLSQSRNASTKRSRPAAAEACFREHPAVPSSHCATGSKHCALISSATGTDAGRASAGVSTAPSARHTPNVSNSSAISTTVMLFMEPSSLNYFPLDAGTRPVCSRPNPYLGVVQMVKKCYNRRHRQPLQSAKQVCYVCQAPRNLKNMSPTK